MYATADSSVDVFATSNDHVTSFCSVNTSSDDVIDLLSRTADQSTDFRRAATTTTTPADDSDHRKPSVPDQSTDSVSDEDFEDDEDDDARRADLSLPDEALRHELDLFRTTRAMLIATATLWLPLILSSITLLNKFR